MESTKKKLQDADIAAQGCREFSSDFHKFLAKMTNGNVVHSPLGVHLILSYLFHGADGLSAKEMVASLHLSNTEKLHLGYRDIIAQLNCLPRENDSRYRYVNKAEEDDEDSIKNVVTLANAIFVNDGITLKKAFKTKGADYYKVEGKSAKFHEKKESVDAINSWISEKTQNKINNMLQPQDIDDLTQVILVNAIYFKARWTNQFHSGYTTTEAFYISETVQRKVPTMQQTERFSFGEIPKLKSKFIVLPYETGEMDMIIILPNKPEGLKFVEEHFDWNAVINAKSSRDYRHLSLPKFKIEATIDLKDMLCAMGMKSMFEARGDFEGVCVEKFVPPLHVDNVKQKVFIDVNEMGTEAAAATIVSVRGGGGPPPAFKVNRPFIAAIRHKSSNVPLFIASVRDLGRKPLIVDEASDTVKDVRMRVEDGGPSTRFISFDVNRPFIAATCYASSKILIFVSGVRAMDEKSSAMANEKIDGARKAMVKIIYKSRIIARKTRKSCRINLTNKTLVKKKKKMNPRTSGPRGSSTALRILESRVSRKMSTMITSRDSSIDKYDVESRCSGESVCIYCSDPRRDETFDDFPSCVSRV